MVGPGSAGRGCCYDTLLCVYSCPAGQRSIAWGSHGEESRFRATPAGGRGPAFPKKSIMRQVLRWRGQACPAGRGRSSPRVTALTIASWLLPRAFSKKTRLGEGLDPPTIELAIDAHRRLLRV